MKQISNIILTIFYASRDIVGNNDSKIMKIDKTTNNITLKLYQPGKLESEILVRLEY